MRGELPDVPVAGDSIKRRYAGRMTALHAKEKPYALPMKSFLPMFAPATRRML